MTCVAIYARYSSDNQREASIEDQIRLCRERAEKEGWQVGETYADYATSGANLLRPGIQSLIQDVAKGRYQVILAEALDRLSRDQEDIAGLYKRTAFAGVKIVTLAEGEVSNLHVGLKGTMNALFLQDLAAKTRRGLRGRVEAGKSGGGNSYGYDVVKKVDGAGNPIRGGRTINGQEASVVRRVFEDFAGGKSPRTIAFALNKEGVPSPSGKGWASNTINGNVRRGTGLLNNEMYIGRIVWNRLRYLKDPDSGKRVSRLNPESEWVVHEAPELRIVDQALWDRVKERQKAVTKDQASGGAEPFRDRRRARHLLSGLLTCGACHGSYVMSGRNNLQCSNYRYRGTCNNGLGIRRDLLEERVLAGLKRNLFEPESFAAFAEAYTKEVNRRRIDRNATLEAQRTELKRIDAKLRNLVEVVAARGKAALSLLDQMETLEARKEELTAILADAEDSVPLLHPNMSEIYRKRLDRLYELLNRDSARGQAAEVLRSMIQSICLIPQDGALTIEIGGDLAGLLAFASTSESPAAGGASGACQFEVVAGARNHLYRVDDHAGRGFRLTG